MRVVTLLALLPGCAPEIVANGSGYVDGVVPADGDAPELPISVWYPADVAEASVRASYAFEITSEAFVDATPATGPFPMVVVSHGNGGSRYAGAPIYERWAEQGYVVVTVDHVGNTYEDRPSTREWVEIYVRRPTDVARAYQQAVAWGAEADHPLEDRLLTDVIAVAGHSTGGATALLAAGGGMDRSTLLLACGAGQLTGEPCDLAEAAEGDSVYLKPEGLPSPMASILMAPLNGGLFQEGVGDASGATLVLVGDQDDTTPLDRDAQPIFDEADPPKALGVLQGGNHYGFATVCGIPGLELVLEEVAEQCGSEDYLSQDQFVDITATLGGAWLDAHLGADGAALDAATSAAATMPVEWTVEAP